MNTDNARTIASRILDGANPYEIPDTLLTDRYQSAPPPTPMARIRALEECLKEALNIEHARIENDLLVIDQKLLDEPSDELWTNRHELTSRRNHLFDALDYLLAVEQHVRRDENDKLPLSFHGWKCAEASGQRGKKPRWADIALYRTLDHKWVCQRIGRTRMPGEETRYEGAQVDTDWHVAQFFGGGPLSQSLYAALGIVSHPGSTANS